MLAIFSIHTGQSTSSFSTNQFFQNTNENSFKHFIKHMVGVRENPEL